MNRVILLGNLTRDPESRSAGSSTVVGFGLACNRRYKNSAGELVEDTMFIDCEAWGPRGEAIARYFNKGSQILVEGELRLHTWEDKVSNTRRSKHTVTVSAFEFVGKKGEGGGKSKDEDQPPPEDEIPF